MVVVGWGCYSNLSKSCKSIHFQVTGANKGVGFAIVRGLCKKFDGDVFLTGKFYRSGLEDVFLIKHMLCAFLSGSFKDLGPSFKFSTF